MKQLGLAAWNYSFLNLISLFFHLFTLFNVVVSISSYNLVVTAAYMYRNRPSTLIKHRIQGRIQEGGGAPGAPPPPQNREKNEFFAENRDF
jgi:hypothetical protein